MLSDTWCYYLEPNSNHRVLQLDRPITKQQAIYILKKRLQISKVYFIISCNKMKGQTND